MSVLYRIPGGGFSPRSASVTHEPGKASRNRISRLKPWPGSIRAWTCAGWKTRCGARCPASYRCTGTACGGAITSLPAAGYRPAEQDGNRHRGRCPRPPLEDSPAGIWAKKKTGGAPCRFFLAINTRHGSCRPAPRCCFFLFPNTPDRHGRQRNGRIGVFGQR